MRIEIIIDETDSGFTPLDPFNEPPEFKTQISAATAIIAGQVLPALMEIAFSEGAQHVRTLRWPSNTGGKVGYVLVEQP